MTITETLFSLQDKKYRDFQAKLIPTVPSVKIIGVRTPELKAFAKSLLEASGGRENASDRTSARRENASDKNATESEIAVFLAELPHEYFDQNQLHAFLISGEKSFEKCVCYIEEFLPFVDNWATCDQLCPSVFKKQKNHPLLLPYIEKWISSEKTYTVRFAIKLLMQHFLDEDFSEKYPEKVGSIKSEEYYVRMMQAWYFATALAKQYDATLPFIEQGKLDEWTHNKAIQKAVESYRITDEQKLYLKGLKKKIMSN